MAKGLWPLVCMIISSLPNLQYVTAHEKKTYWHSGSLARNDCMHIRAHNIEVRTNKHASKEAGPSQDRKPDFLIPATFGLEASMV